MSDNNKSIPRFSEREMQLLSYTMQSLKGGPPDVDFEKLAALAGMGNPGSARNAWAKIKVKLMDGEATAATKPTAPRKMKSKSASKATDVDTVVQTIEANGEDPATKKFPSPRKRKATIKKEDNNGGSPKKKSRKAKAAPEEDAAPEVNDGEDASEATTLITLFEDEKEI